MDTSTHRTTGSLNSHPLPPFPVSPTRCSIPHPGPLRHPVPIPTSQDEGPQKCASIPSRDPNPTARDQVNIPHSRDPLTPGRVSKGQLRDPALVWCPLRGPYMGRACTRQAGNPGRKSGGLRATSHCPCLSNATSCSGRPGTHQGQDSCCRAGETSPARTQGGDRGVGRAQGRPLTSFCILTASKLLRFLENQSPSPALPRAFLSLYPGPPELRDGLWCSDPAPPRHLSKGVLQPACSSPSA